MAAKKTKPVMRSEPGFNSHGRTLNSETTGITSGWYIPPAHRDPNDTLIDEIASWKRADDLGETDRAATRELLEDVHAYVESTREVVSELEELREEIKKEKLEGETDKRRLSDEKRQTLSGGVWQRMRSNGAWYVAKQILGVP